MGCNFSNINIELILSVSGIVIALLGLYYTFTVDGKVKKQEKELNRHALEKIQEEKVNSRKAILDLSVEKITGYEYMVSISNIGLSQAKNIRFERTGDLSNFNLYTDRIFPFDVLLPNKTIKIKAHSVSGELNTLSAILIWDDDFKTGNELELHAPIPS